MAVVKVIEILAESESSWEDAAQKAVTEAGKTLHGIRSVWIQNMNAEVQDGKIIRWRMNCKISFELDGAK